MVELQLEQRERQADGSWSIVQRPARWDEKRTAVIVCDMWDRHHCKSAEKRTGELAPRMNQLVCALRDKGMLILHAPSDTMRFYADHPARKPALAAPAVEMPARPQGWSRFGPDTEPPLPVDASKGGCDCHPSCPNPVQGQWPWSRQIATIPILDKDVVGEGRELYYVMKQRGLDHVILMGVHTNMCILNRYFGLRQLTYLGVPVALVRDMTDAMYSPDYAPFVDHFSGTRLVIEHIEKYWCSTITSDQMIGGKPFRFAADPQK